MDTMPVIITDKAFSLLTALAGRQLIISGKRDDSGYDSTCIQQRVNENFTLY